MTRTMIWPLILSSVTVALLTITPAIYQGKFTNRWEMPAELVEAADALTRFPRQIGSWEESKPGDQLSAGVMRELGLAGYVSRFYRRRGSDELVLLLLMAGQPGPLVRHPPDICFANQANTFLGESMIDVSAESGVQPANESEFRVLRYQHDSQVRDPFRVAYAFTTDGTWTVPKQPRIAFGAFPALYKVHIQAVDPVTEDPSGKLPIEDFVSQFVPAFAEYLKTESLTDAKTQVIDE